MKFEKIISDLRNKVYYPVYYLVGEEPYFIDEITNCIATNLLSETEKEFNQSILYGKETDVPLIISYAKRFPMMANYQVVIVKEAQNIKEIDQLISYIETPLKSTILVICYKYKKFDKRTKFAKVLSKSNNVVLFDSQKLYDNKIPDWITNYIQKQDYKISPQVCVLLADSLGSNLGKITNELKKLTLNIPEKTEITAELVEQFIGISKDYNVFELQKALGVKNIFKANQIINYFKLNVRDNPLLKIVAILYSFFIKVLMYHYIKDKSRNNVASVLSINPFFIKDYQIAASNYNAKKLIQIISLFREYDLKSKGVDNVSTNDGELMKELIFKILH